MATWLSGISRQHRIIRKNIFLWFGLFLLAFLLVILRFAWLQGVKGAELRARGERQYKRSVTLAFKRGPLLDRNYVQLALDSERYSIYADPSLAQYPEFIAAQLAPALHLPAEEILADLSEVTVQSRVKAETADAVRALNLPGITVESEGYRLKVGVDWRQIENVNIFTNRLAKMLNRPVKALRDELGVKVIEPAPPAPSAEAGLPASSPADTATATPTAAPAPAPARQEVQFVKPSGVTWLKSSYPETARLALGDLKKRYPGLLYQPFETFGVVADQRQFAVDPPVIRPESIAPQLAAVLGLSADEVVKKLGTRSRFTKIKVAIEQNELQAVRRLLATMFVVQPGKLFDAVGGEEKVAARFDEAVERLHRMLNDKDAPERVSREVIRRRLMPDAQPGVLGEKWGKDGKPDFEIPRKLFAIPIPGVCYGLPGIGILQEQSRHYPFKRLASATLGWVGDMHTNPHGVFGLEETLEEHLRGKNGSEEKEIDLRRRIIPGRSKRVEPVNGLAVMLTLDLTIQQAAEEWLSRYVQGPDGRAARGQCIVMDPDTGEILALATSPSWDANAPSKSTIPQVNPAVSNFYEPGSTFKVVAVMGALEEKLVRDGQTVTNCAGAMPVGRRTIHEAHNAHGTVDCKKLLAKSCNIGAAQLALRLGPERFLKWCERLGLGQKTGIELGQESPGLLNRENVDAKITLANMGFGQSLAVTPVQMAAVYAVIANGGEWVQPHLVKAYQQPDGTWKEKPLPERRRVCTTHTAELMRGYLEAVTEPGGTASQLSLKKEGYLVGGKTGTAQKAENGRYQSGKYVGSFIGVFPIEHTRFIVVTVIDEPKGAYYGGVVAGPVTRGVGYQALQYLNIAPTLAVEQGDQGRQ